jgi:hypothetical protein
MNMTLCNDAQQTDGVPMTPCQWIRLRNEAGGTIAMQYVTLSETSGLPKPKSDDLEGSIPLVLRMKPIRIGSYTLDAKTNVIRWKGELLRLSNEERQTLRVMLQHAGQILSHERLASLLHTTSDKVDDHMHSLRITLLASGVTYLPRRAEGCGYILWR